MGCSGYRSDADAIFAVYLRNFAASGGSAHKTDSGALLTLDILLPQFLIHARDKQLNVQWQPPLLDPRRMENPASAKAEQTAS